MTSLALFSHLASFFFCSISTQKTLHATWRRMAQ
jgi:hypothetical protein